MLLRNKLRPTQMSKTDTIAAYLMKITELRDQLAAVGEEVKGEELVPITVNGFSSSWQPFVRMVCAQKELPTFESLWDHFIQEETRLETIVGIEEEEQNLSLIGKMKKCNKDLGRIKKGRKRTQVPLTKERTRDTSTASSVRSLGTFLLNDHEKKGKGKQQQQQNQFAGSVKASAGVDELSSKLETHFSMVSCLSSNTMSRVGWYADSGASKHMTSKKRAFSQIQEQEASMQLELGDDATYPVAGVGYISFQIPSSGILELIGVLYVPGLTKNLFSVSVMTNLGYMAEF